MDHWILFSEVRFFHPVCKKGVPDYCNTGLAFRQCSKQYSCFIKYTLYSSNSPQTIPSFPDTYHVTSARLRSSGGLRHMDGGGGSEARPSPGSHSCAITWEGAGGSFQWSNELDPSKTAPPSPLHTCLGMEKGCP